MENVVNVVNRSVKRLGYCKLKKAQEDVVIGFMSGVGDCDKHSLVLPS